MGSNSKNEDSRSTSTLDLGKARKKRIAKFCAQVEHEKGERPTIEATVNQAVDEFLDARHITLN